MYLFCAVCCMLCCMLVVAGIDFYCNVLVLENKLNYTNYVNDSKAANALSNAVIADGF